MISLLQFNQAFTNVTVTYSWTVLREYISQSIKREFHRFLQTVTANNVMCEHNTIYSKNYHNMDWYVVSVHKTTIKQTNWNIKNITAAYVNDVRAGATMWGESVGHDGAELQMRSGLGTVSYSCQCTVVTSVNKLAMPQCLPQLRVNCRFQCNEYQWTGTLWLDEFTLLTRENKKYITTVIQGSKTIMSQLFTLPNSVLKNRPCH